MVLPTTYVSVVLLLLLALACLGSWANTFRLAGTKWRFELFYFDFALGALLLSLIAAYTFGTLGPELAFNYGMLLAGRQAQLWVVVGGIVFNLGNMLLVAAFSLVGMSVAFPLCAGVALLAVSFFNFRPGNVFVLVGGLVLMVAALLLDAAASRFRDLQAVKPAKAAQRTAQKSKPRKTTKGLALGIVGGILLGLSYPITQKSMAGEFGVTPYGGTLLFSLGILASTVLFNFYFMNIAIQGGRLGLNAYFGGEARQHFLGFAGGALWALGTLAAALAISAAPQTGPKPPIRFILPLASVLLTILWGVTVWKEFSAAPKTAKISIALMAIFFAGGVVLSGFGITG